MTSDWLGGGLIVGLAAVLWLIYLLPTWFRRNEYLATERNVVRLQQTLRILAETAEAPDEVRAEASARSVVEQQRLLKKVTVNNTPPALLAAAKIRRARAVTSAILVLALAVVGLGAVQIAVNGAWVLLVLGAIAATLCVTRLGRLAKDGRSIRLPTPSSDVAVRGPNGAGRPEAEDDAFDYDDSGVEGVGADYGDDAAADGEYDIEAEEVAPSWTPVPLPQPLYAGQRRLIAAAGASIYAEQTAQQAEDALRAAARQAEAALRAASRGAEARHPVFESAAADAVGDADARADAEGLGGFEPSATAAATATAAAATTAAPSRFSSMGIVDDADTGSFDVDQVLARRRAG